jgi:hypothetical protein
VSEEPSVSGAAEPSETCIYCGLEKPLDEFSDEHIWPDALGGDFLERFWRTNSVCARCNSMSGVFVDGAFIRSWAGARERWQDGHEYLSLTDPSASVLPLAYLGRLTDSNISEDEIADCWAGPCGATIVHIRPKEGEELWSSYLGGDPRAKKGTAGRAYIALASASEYWIVAALASFKKHFKRAQRRVVNMDIPATWTSFESIDRSDPEQQADLAIFDAITDAARAEKSVHARSHVDVDAGNRLLCKLALALGSQLFGKDFGDHPDGALLRRAFREADRAKRSQIPVHGSGYFASAGGNVLSSLAWPAGWLLLIRAHGGKLALNIVTPSGAVMIVQITDDAELLKLISTDFDHGMIWLTIPPLGRAAGPIPFPDYVAHRTMNLVHPGLASLEAARIDPDRLPPCDSPDNQKELDDGQG